MGRVRRSIINHRAVYTVISLFLIGLGGSLGLHGDRLSVGPLEMSAMLIGIGLFLLVLMLPKQEKMQAIKDIGRAKNIIKEY